MTNQQEVFSQKVKEIEDRHKAEQEGEKSMDMDKLLGLY